MKKTAFKRQDEIHGLLFALPWIIGFFGFSVIPFISSFYYSFTEFNPILPAKWVGLENYRYILSDPLLYKSLFNTFFYAFISTPVNLGIALGLAMLITRSFRGRTVVRTIFFVPSIIPMVAATMVWIWMFDPTYGFINAALGGFGLEGPAWLINPKTTKWALVIMGAWCTGTTMLICLAALQDVPKSYYESAEIDGASSAVKFFRITIPCISPVAVYQLILNLINSFQYFTQVYIITAASSGRTSAASGGPENSILMYPLYLFHNAFIYMRMGRASAMAWILFVIIGFLTLLMIKSAGKSINSSGGE
ncbi:MAG: sugar ABC transporter permease [Spirochaetaceae bacterium]|jgi:multiple sugar transport system permease protein|nr:sugar ABC transporter permease [Spirochaetaceae bacterium]